MYDQIQKIIGREFKDTRDSVKALKNERVQKKEKKLIGSLSKPVGAKAEAQKLVKMNRFLSQFNWRKSKKGEKMRKEQGNQRKKLVSRNMKITNPTEP